MHRKGLPEVKFSRLSHTGGERKESVMQVCSHLRAVIFSKYRLRMSTAESSFFLSQMLGNLKGQNYALTASAGPQLIKNLHIFDVTSHILKGAWVLTSSFAL